MSVIDINTLYSKEYVQELISKGPYCGIYTIPPKIIAQLITRPTTPVNLSPFQLNQEQTQPTQT